MHDEKPDQVRPPARLETGIRTAFAALLLGLVAACDAGGETTSRAADGAQGTQQPAAEGAASGSALTDDAAKASYSLGYRYAENAQHQFRGSIQQEAFVDGVRDQLAGNASRVDDAEAQRVVTALVERLQAEADHQALENLEAGLAFLEKNGQRDGVVTLESGLQYEVLQQGKGEKPKPTDIVTTHYEGRLIDGTVFDSSYRRGEPASFPLNRVIPGWTEGLQLMSPGAKYRLYVPAELAYGERGAGQVIPPNSTLIFDVELLEIAQENDEGADAPEPDSAQ